MLFNVCTTYRQHTCVLSNIVQRLLDTKGGGEQSSGRMASHSISTNALPTTPATTVVFTGKILKNKKTVYETTFKSTKQNE
jgi:hypothetical protein